MAWILTTIRELQLQPPPAVAVMPLGTGNDLSLSFGWGNTFLHKWIAVCTQLHMLMLSCKHMLLSHATLACGCNSSDVFLQKLKQRSCSFSLIAHPLRNTQQHLDRLLCTAASNCNFALQCGMWYVVTYFALGGPCKAAMMPTAYSCQQFAAQSIQAGACVVCTSFRYIHSWYIHA